MEENILSCFAISYFFTVWGWNHILHKKDRTEKQRIARMELLPYARKVIMKATEYYKRRTLKEYVMYEVQGSYKEIKISVIVSKKGRKYYFLSVMKA